MSDFLDIFNAQVRPEKPPPISYSEPRALAAMCAAELLSLMAGSNAHIAAGLDDPDIFVIAHSAAINLSMAVGWLNQAEKRARAQLSSTLTLTWAHKCVARALEHLRRLKPRCDLAGLRDRVTHLLTLLAP